MLSKLTSILPPQDRINRRATDEEPDSLYNDGMSNAEVTYAGEVDPGS